MTGTLQTSGSLEPLPPSVPRPGEVIGGKYICDRVLGTGGMGVVIGARHEQLGQQVAIKVLLPDALKDPVATERFLREARAAIAIRSEHVARVMDFGTLDSGAPYLVMEHLEGDDLKELLIRKGPLPVDTLVDFVIQACEALCEAHKRGIVHRDLKPANLFLTSRMDGSPHIKVLDFGISKTVSLASPDSGSGKGITKTDAVFGTPAYMSPEQLRSSKFVDHRTDIWALGVVIHELLTTKLPFGAWTDGVVAMCAHILEDPPPSLHGERPEVPSQLDAVVARCLAKNPADRFQSIAELTEALLPFASASSAETAARIARMSSDSLPYDSTVKSESGPLSAGLAPSTSSAWGRTNRASRGRSFVVIGASTLAIGFAVGGAWMLGSRSGERNPAHSPESSAPAVASPAPHPSPPVSTAAAPTPPLPPLASITPAASVVPAVTHAHTARPPATAPSAAKAQPAPSAPAAPACEPGKVMSNGHCCRMGFEWKGGECVPGVAKGL
jgi:serine/threonine-protein kinase